MKLQEIQLNESLDSPVHWTKNVEQADPEPMSSYSFKIGRYKYRVEFNHYSGTSNEHGGFDWRGVVIYGKGRRIKDKKDIPKVSLRQLLSTVVEIVNDFLENQRPEHGLDLGMTFYGESSIAKAEPLLHRVFQSKLHSKYKLSEFFEHGMAIGGISQNYNILIEKRL